MKKIIENTLLGVCTLTSAHLQATAAINKDKPSSPNVILIITDDQSYGDMSCHGNPFIQTPQIDKLYRESVKDGNSFGVPFVYVKRVTPLIKSK